MYILKNFRRQYPSSSRSSTRYYNLTRQVYLFPIITCWLIMLSRWGPCLNVCLTCVDGVPCMDESTDVIYFTRILSGVNTLGDGILGLLDGTIVAVSPNIRNIRTHMTDLWKISSDGNVFYVWMRCLLVGYEDVIMCS